MPSHFSTSKGNPFPYGVLWNEKGANFALVSTRAESVTLCLFDPRNGDLLDEITLSRENNKTGNVWHILVHDVEPSTAYAYKITPTISQKQRLLSDPYAKSLTTGNEWGSACFIYNPIKSYFPFGEVASNYNFDWGGDKHPQIPLKDLIIYEMHVRGFTKHPSSNSSHPGTFLGVIDKIPHLLELGINAVELLPVQEFNEDEYRENHRNTKRNLYNYWGYSTVNFFCPMNRYASSSAPQAAIHEFKMMVKELHKHGIEVILDIVFNHTAEGSKQGPVYSYKGIDNAIYYILDNKGDYSDFTGCGNTFSANSSQAIDIIISCLRHWVIEMHVDGFRFDLASSLKRGTDGQPLSSSPLIEAISNDPILANIKLIAEPWDAVGLYQVGSFSNSKRWCEWNGKYRDSVRHFIKGDQHTHGDFAKRLCGSEDLYHHRSPSTSINFVTAHDGFTLEDLVSYNHKHNMPNGENNRDGLNDNISWNCGIEGPTGNKKVLMLRGKQMRNFHLALMVSQGIPMLHMGDEYGHTKDGNNNTWCQDNDLSWFLWDHLDTNASFYRFYRLMVQFRKNNPLLRRETFLTNNDISWHGAEPYHLDWSSPMPFLAFTLNSPDGNHLYIAFNPQDRMVKIKLPPPPLGKEWEWVVNTAKLSPEDFYEEGKRPRFRAPSFDIEGHSAIMLQAVTS